MDLPYTTGRPQRLGEHKEIPSSRGQLDLFRESLGADYWHGGGNIHPSRAQALGTHDPGGHTGDIALYGPEGTRTHDGKAPLRAPRGARGGGTPLPRPTCSIPGGGVDQACLLPESHCNMVDWRALVVKTSARLTHMAEISRREHTHLGFCNA